MDERERAKSILDIYEEMRGERVTYESNWQEIRDLVRPGAADFTAHGSPGEVRTERIYDGTAPQALVDLAGGLHAFLTSPSERWFTLEIVGMEDLDNEPEALDWLETVSDLIYSQYSRGESRFNSCLQEAYQDIGGFGTTIVNQEYKTGGLWFRTMSLADCYLAENADGVIDTVYRRVYRTSRQLVQQFGSDLIPTNIQASKQVTKKYEVIHAVFPRTEYVQFQIHQKDMPFASFWVLKDNQPLILSESGYRSLPYHAGRWNKLPDEVYGRGPAINCLPDIKMLNRMEYTNIKAVSKAVDPPIMVPHDGFLAPIKTAPGSINMMEPGSEEIKPLPTSDKILVGLEYTEQKRQKIKESFYSEWVKLMPKKERQTAYEIAELVEQQLRMMAPMLGRVQGELIGPIIARSYELMREHNAIPEPPAALHGRQLRVAYLGQAAMAQKGQKAVQMGRYAQDLIPLAQVDPAIMDAIDTDAFAQELALVRGTPRKILRTPEEILARRQDRLEQQRMAALQETLEPASKAVKNLADAQRLSAAGGA